MFQERIRRENVSRSELFAITLLLVILCVPYFTKMLPWAYGEGLFPVRPVFYQLALGGLTLWRILRHKPDVSLMAMVLLTILLLRAIDTVFLQRFIFPDDQWMRATGMISSVFVTIIFIAAAGVMHRSSWFPAKIVAFVTVAICAGSVWIELAGWIETTEATGRYSGFMGDPNRACVAMAVMSAVFLTLHRGFWPNIAILVIAAAGMVPTLSRGGFLMLVLLSLTFVVFNFRAHAGRMMVLGMSIAPVLAIAVGVIAAKSSEGGQTDQNAKARMEAIFSGDVDKMSSGERLIDLRNGLEAALSRPVLGWGTGAGTDLWQPHNQLVTIWLDLGILGLALYLLLLGMIAWKTVSSGLRTLYLAIPLIGYVPLSQALLENFVYFYGVAICSAVASRSFFSVHWFAPRIEASPPRAYDPSSRKPAQAQAAYEVVVDEFKPGDYAMCTPDEYPWTKEAEGRWTVEELPAMDYVVPPPPSDPAHDDQ